MAAKRFSTIEDVCGGRVHRLAAFYHTSLEPTRPDRWHCHGAEASKPAQGTSWPKGVPTTRTEDTQERKLVQAVWPGESKDFSILSSTV